MMEKAYSLFLLISVVFLPSTAAGRVLLHTAQTEGEGGHHGGNDGNKIGVTGSHSNTAPSKSGSSSPSEPTPTRISYTRKPATAVCGQGSAYRACLRNKNQGPPVAACGSYKRNC